MDDLLAIFCVGELRSKFLANFTKASYIYFFAKLETEFET
jgi:hypothetical protein